MRASKHKAGRESLISGTPCDRSTHLTFQSTYVCVLCGYLKEQHVESSMAQCAQCGAEKIQNNTDTHRAFEATLIHLYSSRSTHAFEYSVKANANHQHHRTCTAHATHIKNVRECQDMRAMRSCCVCMCSACYHIYQGNNAHW